MRSRGSLTLLSLRQSPPEGNARKGRLSAAQTGIQKRPLKRGLQHYDNAREVR